MPAVKRALSVLVAIAPALAASCADDTTQVAATNDGGGPDGASPIADASPDHVPTYEEAVHRFKAQLLRETLEQTGWNVAETAKRLDLARSHLYNLIGAYGIVRERRP